MTTDSKAPTGEPSYDPDDVLFNAIYGVRTIELNRPKKLNSLNASMARKIRARLKVRRLASLPVSHTSSLNDCYV